MIRKRFLATFAGLIACVYSLSLSAQTRIPNETGYVLAATRFSGSIYYAWQGYGSTLNIGSLSGSKVTFGDTGMSGALAVLNDRLYFAWVGTDPQHLLNVMSSNDGVNFSNKCTLNEMSTAIRGGYVSMTAGGGYLYMAWTGTDRRVNVLRSTDGVTWTNKVTFTEKGNPSLTYGGGKVHLVWVDGTTVYTRESADGISWTNKQTYTTNLNDGVTACYTTSLNFLYSTHMVNNSNVWMNGPGRPFGLASCVVPGVNIWTIYSTGMYAVYDSSQNGIYFFYQKQAAPGYTGYIEYYFIDINQVVIL
jgi:hypothetical protein